MLARIRKAQEENEGGFTLIELLVVIIIIGILAAIAIPVFLNQRKKGWDAQAKSDLRNAATAEETYLTDQGNYTNVEANLEANGFKPSPQSGWATTSAVVLYDTATPPNVVAADGPTATGGYCMKTTAASGNTWYYNSLKGGLQPAGTAAC
jgi:type IV pilus assembly protein PilA